MPKQIERSRLAVWFLVLVTLLFAFVIAWKKVEQEASDTALLVASNRIVERANFYKQQWLLSGEPDKLTLNHKVIHYSKSGWVKPLNLANKVDCHYWLALFYEEERVLESLPIKIKDNSKLSGFQCEYFYSREHAIYINLVDNKFSVGVSFSSEHEF
ncbi:MSHA biogenesis protein MshF [Vibrio sp. 404]|uniref:MSHA biogenesis protein MshF n=1 Tax=Vibrio marinisediminis TaxID=2758441 RepID=A0A7W2FPW1_9VIBR|nr:MSHA biogenesis protein MshF [Vibrio marinisediminis]MBA5762105.1 MSHA biogenesis protein MshF [Vibrio marinisediminis]